MTILHKTLPKPLELDIKHQTIRFHSIEEFEFALTGRTSIPSKKISEIVHFSVEQLNDEAITIKNVESYFASIIADSMQVLDSIDRALRETEPLVFSQDHGWREIIAALNKKDEPLVEFKHLAIVKYLQYLAARQDLISYLYSEKTRLPSASITNSLTIESNIYNEESDVNGTTLDMVRAIHGQHLNNNMQRMPKGEKMIIELPVGSHIDIVISKYKCKLISKKLIHFVDNDGNEYPLNTGKNIIGRDTICNIMLDKFLRDISRVHLVIVKRSDHILELTDLSSHGTFIPSEHFMPRAVAVQ